MPDAVWEIDEFHGRLAGRVLAELELQREQQTYIRPDFVGQEVTGLPQYYNANM
jgi:CYTH domain-containing protein